MLLNFYEISKKLFCLFMTVMEADILPLPKQDCGGDIQLPGTVKN